MLAGVDRPVLAGDLAASVVTALQGNRSIRADEASVRAAQAGRDMALSGYRPTLQAYGETGYQRLETVAFARPGVVSNTLHPSGYGLQLNQNLWNGFKTQYSVEKETAAIGLEQAKLQGSRQSLLLDVVTAYMNVIREQQMLGQYRTNAAVMARRARELEARQAAGLAIATDVDQARAYASKAGADELAAQSNCATAAARYRLLVGRDPGDLSYPSLPTALIPRDLETAVAIARGENPAIAAATASARLAAKSVDIARSGHMPSVDFQANADRHRDPLSAPSARDITSYVAMVRLTVPLYTGGLTTATVQQAQQRAAEQEHRLHYQRETIESGVVAAWGQYQTAGRIVAAAQSQVAFAERAFRGVEVGEAAGLRAQSDYYEARRVLVEARAGLASARRDRIVAAFGLLQAMGRLTPEVFTGLGRETATRDEADLTTASLRRPPPPGRRRPQQPLPVPAFDTADGPRMSENQPAPSAGPPPPFGTGFVLRN